MTVELALADETEPRAGRALAFEDHLERARGGHEIRGRQVDEPVVGDHPPTEEIAWSMRRQELPVRVRP